jgi:gamma-glutamyltranspeptidase
VEPHGAVTSESKICSVIGTDTLKAGGSAVDAAIATMFCVGVTSAHHSGIGGGHFMIVHDHKTAITDVIDAREIAPMHANKGMFANDPAAASKVIRNMNPLTKDIVRVLVIAAASHTM